MRRPPPKGRPPIEQLAQKFMGQLAAIPDGFCAMRAMGSASPPSLPLVTGASLFISPMERD